LTWRTLNPKDSIYQKKLIKNDGSQLPPTFNNMAKKETRGTSGDGDRSINGGAVELET